MVGLFASVKRMASRIVNSLGSVMVRVGSRLSSTPTEIVVTASPEMWEAVKSSKGSKPLGIVQSYEPTLDTREASFSEKSRKPMPGQTGLPRRNPLKYPSAEGVMLLRPDLTRSLGELELITRMAYINAVDAVVFHQNGQVKLQWRDNVVNYYPKSKKRTAYREGEPKGFHGCTPQQAIGLVKAS